MLAGQVAVLAGAVAGLHLLGSGSLAAPPLMGGSRALQRWLEAHQPAAGTFAVFRLCALAVGWYLLATTVVAVVLRVSGADRAAAVADALSLPGTRRLVRAVAGLSLAASAVTAATSLTAAPGPAGASPLGDPDAGVTMRRLPDESGVVMPPPPDEEVVMRRLPDEPAAATPPEHHRTVRAGDHFWSVAEEVLAGAWGRSPTDGETAPYWSRLVEANRHRLVDRDNADLLFPGQLLEVPSPPPAPG